MPDVPKWKIDPKQIRQPDPRQLAGKTIDGKPMKLVGRLLDKKKPKP